VNGIDVGLFCSTPAVALTRNVPIKRAMEMLLTGEMIDAATALEIGLVNVVVPHEALLPTARDATHPPDYPCSRKIRTGYAAALSAITFRIASANSR